jgi:electron transfer flavoprotein beta subunit
MNPETNTLIREGIPSVTNPFDKNALELALTIKEKHDAEVIAICMGPPQAEEVLREALAMGVDKAFLLTDRKFAGADTLATSYTLSLGIKKILKESNEKRNYLVICGAQAVDGDTGQVGPELAEELKIPQITYVQKFELKNNKIIAERIFRPEEVVVIETELPALISVIKNINIPRYPSASGIVDAYTKKVVLYFDADALKPNKSKIGLKGSMTEVWKMFLPERKEEQVVIKGTIEEIAQKLCANLKNDKIL